MFHLFFALWTYAKAGRSTGHRTAHAAHAAFTSLAATARLAAAPSSHTTASSTKHNFVSFLCAATSKTLTACRATSRHCKSRTGQFTCQERLEYLLHIAGNKGNERNP